VRLCKRPPEWRYFALDAAPITFFRERNPPPKRTTQLLRTDFGYLQRFYFRPPSFFFFLRSYGNGGDFRSDLGRLCSFLLGTFFFFSFLLRTPIEPPAPMDPPLFPFSCPSPPPFCRRHHHPHPPNQRFWRREDASRSPRNVFNILVFIGDSGDSHLAAPVGPFFLFPPFHSLGAPPLLPPMCKSRPGGLDGVAGAAFIPRRKSLLIWSRKCFRQSPFSSDSLPLFLRCKPALQAPGAAPLNLPALCPVLRSGDGHLLSADYSWIVPLITRLPFFFPLFAPPPLLFQGTDDASQRGVVLSHKALITRPRC